MEVKKRRTVVCLFRHRCSHAGAEVDRLTFPRPLRIAEKGAPIARAFALMQSGADRRFSAPALQLRGNDLGIVEDQHVAGTEQRGKIAEEWSKCRLPSTASSRALSRGRAGLNAMRSVGKIEVEQIDAHQPPGGGGGGVAGEATGRRRR